LCIKSPPLLTNPVRHEWSTNVVGIKPAERDAESL
jgi:hypothetical protein